MQTRTIPRRGELYWVDLDPARGSEQAGRRPGLIVSNDTGNRFAPVVIVAAVTTRTPRRDYPVNVRVPSPAGTGLAPGSTVLCSQLTTVAKDRLGRYVGSLPPDLMRQVDDALRVALDLA